MCSTRVFVGPADSASFHLANRERATRLTGPCDDLRIIQIGSGGAAEIATMVLADFGADVVKIEGPGGDPIRAHAAAPMWLRGKRSVVLDLSATEGKNAARQLALSADVVVASFRPGEAQEFGLDYESLKGANPGLVYCSVTGWGPRGPYAQYPADETLVAAKSARMWAMAFIDRREGPGFEAVQVGTHAAAQSATTGILAALEVRERSGFGQLVETSLLQGMFPYDLNNLVREQMLERFPEKAQSELFARYYSPDAQPTLGYQPIMSSDGRWIQLANLLEHLFQASIVSLGLADKILADPRYAGAPNGVSEEAREEIRNAMLLAAQERTADELMDEFKASGNVAADLVGTAQTGLHHADMVANGEVIEAADPDLGVVRQLGPLALLRDTPARIGRPAPRVGEHTAEVLGEPPAPQPTRTVTGDRAAPLAGLTVLEFATIIAAPLGASLLGDLGARVIKVEPTNGGDPMRGMGGAGLTAYLGSSKTTASKESICIDLKTEAGQEIVRRLVVQADMIVHNYRPGVPERLGIGYEQAKAIRPDIIWLSVSGYGPDGEGAPRPAAHPIPGAVDGGALMQVGEGWPQGDLSSINALREAARRFYRANESNPDPNTSVVVATAAMLALHARRRTGAGQEVFVSMLGANAYANADDFLSYAGKPARPTLDSSLMGIGPLQRLYRAKDSWVCLSAESDDMWACLCSALQRDDLRNDSRFKDRESRASHAQDLVTFLTPVFAQRSADEWEHALLEAGVGCVRADDFQSAGQFFWRSEQIKENAFAIRAKHRILGDYQRWGPLVTFSETPGRYGPGVVAGEQTDAILEELSYDAPSIRLFRETGIVWADETAPIVS